MLTLLFFLSILCRICLRIFCRKRLCAGTDSVEGSAALCVSAFLLPGKRRGPPRKRWPSPLQSNCWGLSRCASHCTVTGHQSLSTAPGGGIITHSTNPKNHSAFMASAQLAKSAKQLHQRLLPHSSRPRNCPRRHIGGEDCPQYRSSL